MNIVKDEEVKVLIVINEGGKKLLFSDNIWGNELI